MYMYMYTVFVNTLNYFASTLHVMYIHVLVNVHYACVSCESHVIYCYLGGDRPDGPDDDEEVAYYSDEDGEQDQVLSKYMYINHP